MTASIAERAGRFATVYQERFGQPPSHTLHG
ncbi:Uncharacterised protein [Nocardia brasiliensis]|nr:Uncharacterised protein [Nocardia brasiliensis]